MSEVTAQPALPAAAFDVFARLLHARSGLVIGPDKQYLLDARLRPVITRLKLGDLAGLAHRLRTQCAAELEREVVERMTTNESFFFRDTKPFTHFAEVLLPRLLAKRPPGSTLRIWSAAASTGQEAYSLAMTLAEHQAKLGHVHSEILATDLSRDVLVRAKAGLYTQFEVQRGLPAQLLHKYFRQDGHHWRLDDGIRAKVTFREWNLLHDPASLGCFDAIFCRNVLIYFDQPTKARVLEALGGRLAPNGALYLGSTESIMGLTARLTPLDDDRGVYHRSPG